MWAVVVSVAVLAAAAVVHSAPAPDPQATPAAPVNNNKAVLSPNGFDEILVISDLTVKGRSGPTSAVQRGSRQKVLVAPTPGTTLADTPNGNVTATAS